MSLCGFDEHEIVRILAGQLFMVVAMAKCGRMVESENHSPRQPLQAHLRYKLVQTQFEVLRLYGRLDSYAYAFTCVSMEDMCSAATAPNGYQALESSAFHFVSFEILHDHVASRWYNLLSWIVLFKAIAEDGDTVNKKESETQLAAKGMLALQGLQESRFIMQFMLGLQECF
nr:hypothetical protein [Tanacetum cinerariifolium]